jgi:DNA-binding NtrC family response regulator
MKRKILIVDDEKSMVSMLKILFEKENFIVDTASSGEEAIELLSQDNYDLVISDIKMGGMSGIDLLKETKKQGNPPDVILMTAYASTESAIEALKYGAVDYIVKPFNIDELLHRVKNAIEKKNLLEENIYLKSEIFKEEGFYGIIGRNSKMVEIYSLIQRISNTNSSVLIEGESGTGKELVAKAIHYTSQRKEKPFISINCGGIPETLLESELFGYVKGAFTGAYTSKRGLFDVAENGTLFLDEIGEMPMAMQVKLLRAIQERKIRPVGGTDEHSIDVRLITATNKDLMKLIKDGSFREDLFYRINVIKIEIPPLRERKDDIPLLVHHFLEKYCSILKKGVPKVPKETVILLEEYDYPGNVRELENIIERAVALEQNGVIDKNLLPENVASYKKFLEELKYGRNVNQDSLKKVEEGMENFSLEKALSDFEVLLLKKALELEGGNLSKAAKRLGISYRSIRHLVNDKYREHFKNEK